MLATSITTTVAVIIALLLTGVWLLYAIVGWFRSRAETGSEVELAANRKPYYDDETLEGPRLERLQVLGVLMLGVLTLGLPLYWILEPGRQRGATNGWDHKFEVAGSKLFDVTANGGYNCAGCHGGLKATGGSAPFTLTDPKTGEVKAVNWTAPALDTVLYRFSADEVRFIIIYGRPFSPMSPWGVDGGGALSDQQIDQLVAYIRSIQLPPDGCKTPAETTKASTYSFDIRKADRATTPRNPAICDGGEAPGDAQAELLATAQQDVASGKYATLGEALFNSSYKGGSFSCARCHTRGWSYGNPQQSGGGALGPNLTGGSNVRQCVTAEELKAFLEKGSELGKKYCENGQGSGRMPGLGAQLSDQELDAIVEYVRSL